ncbi:MAG TPA: ATP-binding protein [Steroidobacteraceae bacterium]|nr:ATP-binding protein [Steroidobacteraceae bacterium]
MERALSWMTSPLSRHPAGSDTSPTDLTDTQVAEGEVWESPELLRLIVATLPVGVSVIDRSGNIVLTNAASELIWGDTIVSGEERWARSRAFWHGTSKRIGPSEWASVRCLRDGQTILNELIDIEAFDGRRKTIQNSAVPIRNAAGEIVGSLILNEEVTDRVHAESVLRESADRSQDFSRRLLVVQEEERRHLSRELHDEFERTGIATQVVGEIDDQSGDLAIVCFRAVQEALTNVIRHARAQHVTIELSRAEGLVELTIRDDGVGFDVTKTLDQAAAGGHLGLA